MTDIDLDAERATIPPKRHPSWAWLVSGVALVGLVATLAMPRESAKPPPTSQQTTISERFSDGDSVTSQIWRDHDGTIVTVMNLVEPGQDGIAWCELAVNGEVVMHSPGKDKIAVCVWVRGAVAPLVAG